MARKSGSRRDASEKRSLEHLQEKGIGLIGLGLALFIGSAFISNPVLHKFLSTLRPLGWVAMLAGAAMFGLGWITRRRTLAAAATLAAPSGRPICRAPPQVSSLSDPRVADAPRAEEWKAARGPRESNSPVPTRPTEWGPAVFDVIEWRRFEALVEALFAQAGFETKSQSHGADDGIDIWLYSRSQPGTPVSVVQCKHWQGKRVGVDKVRELRGVMAAKNLARGQFATTSTFTPDAIAFGKDNGINLLDVHGLLGLIAQRSDEQQQALLKVALDGDYWRPTCVNCGTKMVERSPRNGGAAFWGCATFPRCKTTLPMRA